MNNFNSIAAQLTALGSRLLLTLKLSQWLPLSFHLSLFFVGMLIVASGLLAFFQQLSILNHRENVQHSSTVAKKITFRGRIHALANNFYVVLCAGIFLSFAGAIVLVVSFTQIAFSTLIAIETPLIAVSLLVLLFLQGLRILFLWIAAFLLAFVLRIIINAIFHYFLDMHIFYVATGIWGAVSSMSEAQDTQLSLESSSQSGSQV